MRRSLHTARPPDVLGVGAQQCGTMQLFHHLRTHPEVWMYPSKETHYFDIFKPHIGISVYRRIFTHRTAVTKWRDASFKKAAADILRLRLNYFRESLNRFKVPFDDEWYQGLFSPAGARLAAEITPNYCTLHEAQVEEVYQMMPNAKIIILLRNPIERCWAFFLGESKRLGVDMNDLRSVSQAMNYKYITRLNRYPDFLNKWTKYYPREQIFLGVLEEMRSDPDSFFRQLYQFLNLPVHKPALLQPHDFKDVEVDVSKIPVPIYEMLADYFRPDIPEVEKYIGDRVRLWKV